MFSKKLALPLGIWYKMHRRGKDNRTCQPVFAAEYFMSEPRELHRIGQHSRWWRSIGPALITACVVFGPGSLLISSNVGARYGYDLLWLLLLTGVLMGPYVTTATRVSVVGGGTPCTLVAQRLSRPIAAVIGITLCLTCTAFQFSNNLAVAVAGDALGIARIFGNPQEMTDQTKNLINSGVLLVFNGVIIALVFTLKQVYRTLERIMKIMVAVILACFLMNLLVVRPNPFKVAAGLAPSIPSRTEDRTLFTIDLHCVNDLQARINSETLQRQFIDHDRRISREATITVEEDDRKWLISDSSKKYTIIREGNLLIVHKGKLLFEMTASKDDLIPAVYPQALRRQFGEHNIQLSPQARISLDKEGNRWEIEDRKENKQLKWTVLKEADTLNIYEGITFIAPLILIAALLGTTFSVAGALYQGNLVCEKGWTIKEYRKGIGDSIAGVAVLTGVSAIIMITSATVLRDAHASDIGVLARQLQPMLGTTAHAIFCVGLLAVAMNPFVINAMIGGSILADGLGKPAKLSDTWSRRFTVVVLLIGMAVAMIVINTRVEKVDAIIFGQAMTVIGNPLMAATILWLANQKDIMGERRNTLLLNILGGIGLLVVLFIAVRILITVILKLS